MSAKYKGRYRGVAAEPVVGFSEFVRLILVRIFFFYSILFCCCSSFDTPTSRLLVSFPALFVTMRFSFLLLTGMVVVTTALPQRPGGGRGRFRGGQGFGQSAQSGAGIQGANLPGSEDAQDGTQPPAVVPDNAQAGVGQDTAGQGNLDDQDNLPPNAQGSPDNGNQADQGGANNPDPPNDQEAGNANQNGNNIGVGDQDQSGQQTDPNNQGQNNQDQPNQDQPNQDQTPQNTPLDSLIPPFGITPNLNPDGQGNCLGLNAVQIPCTCPPDRDLFIQKVQSAVAAGNSEGVPVEFPFDDSTESKRARIQTSIVVLQNLNGRGVGCPAAATTFLEQKKALAG